MKAWLSVLLVLAGCAAAAGWTKPGADEAAVASAYRDCRATAESAVQREIGINEDILATRQNDWQRAGVGRLQADSMRESTRSRAADIVASCMQGQGFSRAP